MYAVVMDKGNQIKVSEGQEVLIDRMKTPAGELVEFKHVLALGGLDDSEPMIGTPELSGARVVAEVICHEKGPKVHTVRFKGPSQTTIGHRQDYTRVKIREIHSDWGVDNGS